MSDQMTRIECALSLLLDPPGEVHARFAEANITPEVYGRLILTEIRTARETDVLMRDIYGDKYDQLFGERT